MQFGFLGIDYKNADLTIRDEISFTDQKKLEFFHKAEEIGVEQVMILSTCNRSEIYYFFDDEQQIKKIQNIYCDMFDKAEIEQYIRHCEEDKAVSYLSGSDLREAYKSARGSIKSRRRSDFWTGKRCIGFFKNHGI